jgi:hypothetical protein
MEDFEIFEADLFDEVGLGHVPIEERLQFVEAFSQLLGMTGLLLAGDKLPDKDQDTLLRLLEEDETERAEALLTARNIDLQEIIVNEAVRIKRPLIESEMQVTSTDELLMAVKAQLPLITLEVYWQRIASSVEDLHEYLESLPLSDDEKLTLAETVVDNATGNVEDYVSGLVSPEVFNQFGELIEAEKNGEGVRLMLQHGVDFVQINIDEAEAQLNDLKERFRSPDSATDRW